MDRVTVLLVDIEISDQYGTTETQLLGVFKTKESLKIAQQRFEKKCSNKRLFFYEKEAVVDATIF